MVEIHNRTDTIGKSGLGVWWSRCAARWVRFEDLRIPRPEAWAPS